MKQQFLLVAISFFLSIYIVYCQDQIQSRASPPQQEFAPPLQEQDPPTQQFAPPPQNYDSPPQQEFAPPLQEQDPPTQQFAPPPQDYDPPQYFPPIQKAPPPISSLETCYHGQWQCFAGDICCPADGVPECCKRNERCVNLGIQPVIRIKRYQCT